MKNVTRKVYITKRIRTQYLYYKILIGVFIVAVCAFGAVDQYTQRYIASLSPTKVFNHEFIQKAQAKEVSKVEVQTKKAVLAIPEAVGTDRRRVQEVAKVECDKRKLGDFCVKDLMGIAYAESRKSDSPNTDFNCSVVGDGGKSVGCFQIHRGFHKEITVEQAKDVQFAINWTLNRLVKNGYPEYRSNAVMKHNGTPGTKTTLKYLSTVNYFVSTLK